jgi:hypothetical protein
MRSAAALLLAGVVIFTLATAPGIAYAISAPATISGTVYADDGITPVEGAVVTLIDDSWNMTAVLTGADGTYSLSQDWPAWDPDTSTYKVYVDPFDANVGAGTFFLAQYSDASTDGDDAGITLSRSEPAKSGVDMSLTSGGCVTGTVYDTDGTTALPGAPVSLGNQWNHWVAGTETDSEGAYRMYVAAGAYNLGAGPPIGDYDCSDVSYGWVTIKVGESTGPADMTLQPAAGAISGRVTDHDGNPLEGIDVVADPADARDQARETVASTDAGGEYTIQGLPDGDYVLAFGAETWNQGKPADEWLAYQWYDHASRALPTPVTVSGADAVTGIDAALDHGARVTGVVRDASGNPAGTVRVLTADYSLLATTEDDGSYTTGWGLPVHEVTDLVFDPSEHNSVYDVDLLEARASLSVESSLPVSLDVKLSAGGRVGGLVTDSEGVGIPGVWVRLSSSGVPGFGPEVPYAMTDQETAPGSYFIRGVPAGRYTVSFDPTDSNSASGTDFVGQFWSGKDSAETANVAVVTAGEVSTANAVLEHGGTVSGAVLDSTTGLPDYSFAWVGAYDKGTGAEVGSTYCGTDGAYSITGVPSGVDIVLYASGSYATGTFLGQYWSDRATFESADATVVGAGETIVRDFSLHHAGKITGRVLDSEGQPVPFADVTASSAGFSGGDQTHLDGTYRIDVDTQDAVTVMAQSEGLGLAWHGGHDAASATPVTAAADSLVKGIDITYPATSGSISGVVTGAEAWPYARSIELWGLSGGYWANIYEVPVSPTDGSYAFPGVPDGSYRLVFPLIGAIEDRVCMQAYPGVPRPEYGQDIVVDSGAAVDVPTWDVKYGGTVNVSTTDAASGLPLGGVEVQTWYRAPDDSWNPIDLEEGGAWVTSGGKVDIGSLYPGATYTLGFSKPGYAPVFLGGASSPDMADTFTVEEPPAAPTEVGQALELVVEPPADTTSPETTVSSGGEDLALWHNHAVTLTVSATDPGPDASGVDATYCARNASTGALCTGTDVVDAEGTTTFWAWSKDLGGNIETSSSVTVRIDRVAPTTSASVAALYSSGVSINILSADGGSGVAWTEYELDSVAASGSVVATSALGPHKLRHRAVDVAGNLGEWSAEQQFTIVAAAAPTSVSVPSASPSKPRRGKTVTFTAYVSPGAAAITGGSRISLYRSETKTVRKKVRGRWKRVKVKYWRLRNTLAMTSDATGRLTARTKLRYSGKWRAQVTFDGSATHVGSVSGYRSFSVR